jgi:electron transfer flavoprotein alpha subunit
MDKVLVLLHAVDGALPKSALETITAASGLGAAFEIAVVGSAVDGTQYAVVGDAFTQSRYATDAAAAEALIRKSGATLILAPGTMRFNRALPGVAGRLNGAVETHVVGIKADGDSVHASRWFYRQRIEATLSRTARPWILLIEPGSFEPAAAPAGAAPAVVEVAASTRTEVQGSVAPESGKQTIRPDAELLFVAGAGWTKKQKDGAAHAQEASDLIAGFLDRSQASLGSSKSLVDQSGEGQAVLPFLTHLHQVGQTGSTPRHKKGLATCCHGEEPHVVGWRFIHERRAVNLDANCGWARGKADVLYVADAFEVMLELNKLLDQA